MEPGEEYAFLWKWRKYLLLLATLVASVTYVAGLNPPGGVWSEEKRKGGGWEYRVGDPVLLVTFSGRYNAFYYCNAAAFVASLVIIMILLDPRVGGNRVGLTVLRSAMLLDLLALMAAFAAGSCRDVPASIYVSVLFALVFAYVTAHVRLAGNGGGGARSPEAEESLKQRRKFLLLLATFATALTYGAGMAPPGGFWGRTVPGRHLAGVPLLHDGRYARRFHAFFYANATSFVASLAIIMILMSRTLSARVAESYALPVCALVVLLGLMAAYAAGSCRKIQTTVYVVSLAGAVLLYIALQVGIGMFAMDMFENWRAAVCKMLQCAQKEQEVHVDSNEGLSRAVTAGTLGGADAGREEDGPVIDVDANEADAKEGIDESRSLLLLLATLAATVTYQAGLSPPGGVWPADGANHKAGDPVLLETNPTRYRAFFHFNTAAFVASLVVIIIVQSRQLSSGPVVRSRALQAAMVLDLFGLMGAYAAGSCRDAAATIYVSALAVAVFVYTIAKAAAFTVLGKEQRNKLIGWVDDKFREILHKLRLWDEQSSETNSSDDMERKRKFLLQLAILAATVTYQSGLNPPGGFWPESTGVWHAGDPVLLDHYTRRYLVFFYCNATGFMASVAVIILLVNKKLYQQGIRSNALHVCVLVGLLGLMGAYAAGSCRELRTSIYVFALVAAVVASLVLQILLFVFAGRLGASQWLPPWLLRPFEQLSPPPPPTTTTTAGDKKTKHAEAERYAKRKYLMLQGILAASVTYQAGLAPPGGTWGDDAGAGNAAGSPVLRDANRPRYHAFFYCNATSFVCSVVVIVLLLRRTVLRRRGWAPLWAMQTAVVLDLLGLLGAYAAGSCREWEMSAYVIALVAAVVVYIAMHVLLSFDAVAEKAEELKLWKYCSGNSDGQAGADGAGVPV